MNGQTLEAAVDVGGTFTDVALSGPDGQVAIHKVLTDAGQPTRGIVRGLVELCAAVGVQPGSVARIIHGTTLVTNALIERKGAPTGMLTTAGFRDVIEIGNEVRYNTFDLALKRPEPLSPRWARRPVQERTDADGQVVAPVVPDDIVEETRRLVARGIRTVAVCFFNSYANPENERVAAHTIAAAFPDLHVTISSDVAPEIREYERFSTCVANAYVLPLAAHYLRELARSLAQAGFVCPVYLVLSDGGLAAVDVGLRYPVRIAESGPAAGVVMTADLARARRLNRVLSFDMGGTTAKLAVVRDGQPNRTHQFEAARVHRFQKGSGFPLRIPTVDLVEIGAGGGSIAWKDAMGLLKVGPESAGADPGPACYGQGGDAPTVTDADLLLGYLDPAFFLGGRMRLNRQAAERAVGRLADALGLSLVATASGIHHVANNNMATAARIHVAEQGLDPRTHTLVAFGGAGPVHAYGVARLLRIPRVVYPRGAGVASAIGMLVAEPTAEWAQSRPALFDRLNLADVRETVAALRRQAEAFMRGLGVSNFRVRLTADMRYRGQGYEVTVPVPEGAVQGQDREAIRQAFLETYRLRFGRTLSNLPIEVLTWRLRATASRPERILELGDRRLAYGPALKGTRSVFFGEAGGFVPTPVYDRYRLEPGAVVTGPAIIEEDESTIVAGPDTVLRCEPEGTVVLTFASRGEEDA
jgi:N-methylhydantoinase A